MRFMSAIKTNDQFNSVKKKQTYVEACHAVSAGLERIKVVCSRFDDNSWLSSTNRIVLLTSSIPKRNMIHTSDCS